MGHRGRYRIVVGFITTYAISVSPLIPFRRCVLNTTLCDKICQSFATGQWFSQGTPVSFTNKTERYD